MQVTIPGMRKITRNALHSIAKVDTQANCSALSLARTDTQARRQSRVVNSVA